MLYITGHYVSIKRDKKAKSSIAKVAVDNIFFNYFARL